MSPPEVLVLGIGNLLWADEGFGVRAVEAFNEQYAAPTNVTLMDGGTQGIYLVPHLQAADVLIVFDAIDYGLPPGTLKVVHDRDVPKFMGARKMSLHQTGFQEVLAMAELLGHYPERILLIGVQPAELEDYGGSLRPAVKAQLQPALEIAVRYLHDLGIAVSQRPSPLDASERLAAESLDMQCYEAQRPTDADACRLGDARVLASPDICFDPKPVVGEPLTMTVNVDQRSTT